MTADKQERVSVHWTLFLLAALGCHSSAKQSADAAVDLDMRPAVDAMSVGDISAEHPALAGPFLGSDGQRLKMLTAEAEGGRIFLGWHDTQLDIRCSFVHDVQGRLRCLPASPPSSSLIYVDAACTAGAVTEYRTAGPDTCSSAFLRARVTPTGCGNVSYAVYRRAAAVAPGTPGFQKSPVDGRCQPTSRLLDATYLAGEEAPPTMFVAGRLVSPNVRPESANLAMTLLEGEDGSLQFYAWQDVATASTCIIVDLGSEGMRCLTGPLSVPNGTYADPTCQTEPVVYVDPLCRQDPRYATVTTGCPPRTTVHSVSGPAAAVFFKGPSSCVNGALAASQYRQLGPPGAEQSSPEVMASIEPGAGRLRRRLHVAPGGEALVASGSFHDGASGERCTPQLFSSGMWRCAPVPGLFTEYYLDPTCTVPVWSGPIDGCVPKYAVRFERGSCPNTAGVFTIGSPIVGDVYGLEWGESSTIPLVRTCRKVNLTSVGLMPRTLTPIPESELPVVASSEKSAH